jgi:hypothetical protein
MTHFKQNRHIVIGILCFFVLISPDLVRSYNEASSHSHTIKEMVELAVKGVPAMINVDDIRCKLSNGQKSTTNLFVADRRNEM